jgi:hypothetical protein
MSAAQRSARGEVSRGRGAHPEKVALEPELVSAPPFDVVLNHNGSDWHAFENCGLDPLTKPQAAMHGFWLAQGQATCSWAFSSSSSRACCSAARSWCRRAWLTI